jgi:hypothetical protein
VQKITLFICSLFDNAYIGSEYDRTFNEQWNENTYKEVVMIRSYVFQRILFQPCFLMSSRAWEHRYIGANQPPETGIGGLGNTKVTSKFANKYQRRNWESGLSCCLQQVSEETQDRLIAIAVVRTNHRTAIGNCTEICWPLVFLVCDSQICTSHLPWDILLVVWRKFRFYCGTAASSICVT